VGSLGSAAAATVSFGGVVCVGPSSFFDLSFLFLTPFHPDNDDIPETQE
jgi:hypothetical protein